MIARIYKPAKTAMQMGRALTKDWRLEFEPADARFIEPLMGWTGSTDTRGQFQLNFETRDAAVAFAEKHSIPYAVEEPSPHRIRRQAYAENFSFSRRH